MALIFIFGSALCFASLLLAILELIKAAKDESPWLESGETPKYNNPK